MKFKAFKEYRLPGMDAVTKYLSRDLTSNLRELSLGLERLTFKENFVSFTSEVTLPAGVEVAIANSLEVVPSSRIVTRQSGGGAIVDGDTDWGLQFVYLKNTGGSDATATVIFMR